MRANEVPVIRYVASTKAQPTALFIVACNKCKKRDGRRRLTDQPAEHVHGAGGPDADHREMLGHRVPHCSDPMGGGYWIVDPDGLVPGGGQP